MIGLQQKQYLAQQGIKLAVQTAGPANGFPVVLLHGGGQTRHSWSGAMTQLAGEGFYVIAYDARGHGESGWPVDGDYSLAAHASDLVSVMSFEQVRDPVLIGASLGGMTVLNAVATSEALNAAAVVLVDVVPRPALVGVARVIRFMTSHPDGFADLSEAADAVAAYNPHRPRPRNPEGLSKNLRRRPDGRWHWHWDPRILDIDPVSYFDELERVSTNVTVPVLLVQGAESDVVDEDGVRLMERLLPQTQVVQVPGAGHMVAGDNNQVFSSAIAPFLQAIRSGQMKLEADS